MKFTHIILLFSIFLISCSSTQTKVAKKYYTITGKTQGTYYRIVLEHDFSISHTHIDSILHQFDLLLSNYIPNSTISKFNNNEEVAFDSSFIYFFEKSQYFYKSTNGAFDITVAPLVNAWRFGFKNDSLLPDSAKITELLKFTGMNKLQISGSHISKTIPEIQIISNAIAQGYSVDILAHFLNSQGVANYLIDIGGEIKAQGVNSQGKAWTIGINTPKEGVAYNDYQEVVSLKNKSLATSGNYRKFYIENGKKYSHTINPKTGYPVRHNLLSATVITKLCIDADALATACMVMGLEKSIQFIHAHTKYDAILIYEEGDSLLVWKSY